MSDDATRERRSGARAGSSDRRSSGPAEQRAGGREQTPNTALNALVGGVVTVGTALFVPFSPVLGGAVSGYLEGGDSDAGLKVGTLAGLVAMVPMLLVVLLGVAVLPVVGPPRGAFAVLLVGLLVFVLVGAYTVGLSALGGILGTYLKREL